MTLYSRCIKEMAKPELIELYKSDLEILPANTKCELVAALCKNGYFRDATILRLLVTPYLVVVDFGDCFVNDEMLSCLHSCTRLRKLDLSLRRYQGRNITTDALVRLIPNIPHLEILNIPNCKEFNDAVTRAICENCVNLTHLYIQYSSITNESLFLITEKLHFLSNLNIYGTRVDGKGIEFLIKGPLFQKITEIYMDECLNLTSFANPTFKETCQFAQMFPPYSCGKKKYFSFQDYIPYATAIEQY